MRTEDGETVATEALYSRPDVPFRDRVRPADRTSLRRRGHESGDSLGDAIDDAFDRGYAAADRNWRARLAHLLAAREV